LSTILPRDAVDNEAVERFFAVGRGDKGVCMGDLVKLKKSLSDPEALELAPSKRCLRY
jgi:hypothetical protein